MGEMADFALEQMMDVDGIQQRLADVPFSELDDCERELLYDYDGSYNPLVFSKIGTAPLPKPVKQPAAGIKSKKGAGVIDRIGPPPANDDVLKINLYGRSGTGKTTLWGSFPGPILAMVCSGGKKSGELKSLGAKEKKKIQSVELEKSSELTDLVEYQAKEGKFKTLVLDHATDFQNLVLKEVLGLDEIPPQLSWGLATQNQYGQVALQVKERLRGLLGLDCNVVLIAQEREFEAPEASELIMPHVSAALSPSIVGWLNPACDYICQTFIRRAMVEKRVKLGGKEVIQSVPSGAVEYCLRTAPDPVFTTKFRLPKGTTLPDVIVDPTYDKILELVRGNG